MDLPDSISLYFREGTSDKVYEAQIVQQGDGYVVNFAYGRRGAKLTTGTKTPTPVSRDKAEEIYSKLVTEKTDKGYSTNQPGEAPAPPPRGGAKKADASKGDSGQVDL
jgi:bifunctional non-homologous end joining protein LigD